MSDIHPDPLELCVNANFIADALAEFAENKREKCGNRRALQAGPETWAGRLDAWAEGDDRAAATIRGLVAGIERLRSDAERLTGERDAALTIAFMAGRNLFGLPDDVIFRRLGESLRAWMDDDGKAERDRVSAAIMAAYRKAAGLEPIKDSSHDA